MAPALDAVSNAFPMTWAVDGLQRVARGEGLDRSQVVRDFVVIYGIAVLALAAGAATLRRRTP
jgi:ABC-2 type transport system permease protein